MNTIHWSNRVILKDGSIKFPVSLAQGMTSEAVALRIRAKLQRAVLKVVMNRPSKAWVTIAP